MVYPIFNLIVIRTRKFATFKNLGQNVPEWFPGKLWQIMTRFLYSKLSVAEPWFRPGPPEGVMSIFRLISRPLAGDALLFLMGLYRFLEMPFFPNPKNEQGIWARTNRWISDWICKVSIVWAQSCSGSNVIVINPWHSTSIITSEIHRS